MRLKTAANSTTSYRAHWQVGGGKRAFKANGNKLMAGIAKTIDTKPDDKWAGGPPRSLSPVLARVGRRCHQKAPSDPLEERLIRHLGRAHGQTNTKNAYIHFSNIILAGTLFYRPSHYDALKRLGSGRRPLDGPVTKAELDATQDGESMHQILQALCRGSVRKSDGSHCHPCNAWIIASAKSRIPTLLGTIFPGRQQKDWRPVERTLRGHVKAAIEFIGEHLQAEGSMLKFTVVSKALGMTPKDFKHGVRRHDDFKDILVEMGIEEVAPTGKRMTHFLLPFEAI